MGDNHRPTLLSVLLLVLLGLAYFGSFVDYGVSLYDEGTIVYQVERLADGQELYTDFHIGYTPAVFYVHAAVMKAFGFSVIPGRWLLALINTASLVALFLVARRVAPTSLALFAPLLYMAIIEVHPGRFAIFNVPYPVWYNVLLSTLSIWAMMRFGTSSRIIWVVAAGGLAGLNFAFKPNAGLLNLAGLGFALLAVIPTARRDVRGIMARIEPAWWWAFWLATLGGCLAVFSGVGKEREIVLFIVPLFLGGLVAGWRSMVAPRDETLPSIIPATLALGIPFLLLNLPWLVMVWDTLGTDRFLFAVFFVGADFEQFYYLKHPFFPVLTGVTIGAFVLLRSAPRVIRRIGVSPDVGLGLAMLTALAVGYGFVSSQDWTLRSLELATRDLRNIVFWITPAVHWLALWFWVRSISITDEYKQESANWGIVYLGAITLYAQIYPRTDFTHWVTAMPLSLCLFVGILSKASDAWAIGVPVQRRRLVPLLLGLPFVVLLGFLLYPNLIALNAATDVTSPASRAFKVSHDRIPIKTVVGQARTYDSVRRVARFVDSITAPDEKVFTFPALDLISFVSNRHNPTRHGYFYPGWPGHDWEAEVVAALEQDPPRFAVVLHDHAPYFIQAPVYYFMLMSHLDRYYRPYRSIGPYLVLAHKTLGPTDAYSRDDPPIETYLAGAPGYAAIEEGLASDSPERRVEALVRSQALQLERAPRAVLAALKDPFRSVRSAAVRALAEARDSESAAALARAARDKRLRPSARRTALFAAGPGADGNAAVPLYLLAQGLDPELAELAKQALFYASSRSNVEAFWVARTVGSGARVPPIKYRRVRKQIVRTFDRQLFDGRMRNAAIWMTEGLPDDEAVPLLLDINARDDVGFALQAGIQLYARGVDTGLHERAVELMIEDDRIAPRLAGATMSTAPSIALIKALQGSPKWRRGSATWLLAYQGTGRRVKKSLARLLGDQDPFIRMAACWGLGRVGANEYKDLLNLLALTDEDFRVREFASRAIQQLGSESVE